MKVKSMDRLGISAIIIEDKTGLKKIHYLKTLPNKYRKIKINLQKKLLKVKKQKLVMILW